MSATSITIFSGAITGPVTPSAAPVESTSTPLDISAGSGTLRLTFALTPGATIAPGQNPACEVHLETGETSAGPWRELKVVTLRAACPSQRVSVSDADKFARSRSILFGAPSAVLNVTGDMPTAA